MSGACLSVWRLGAWLRAGAGAREQHRRNRLSPTPACPSDGCPVRLQAIELLRALPPADRAASVGGATAHISLDRRQAACEQVNVGTERMSQVRHGR